jgi:hypothetical protein
MLEPSEVVDREAESRRFQELLDEAASHRILAISDDSGWGKSTLLHKLRYICEYHEIPVALVLLDELIYPDEFSVAAEIARQLKQTGCELDSFEKLNQYRAFRDVAAFIDAYRSMSGAINAAGASVSGGQVAGSIFNIERVQSIGAPDWSADAEKQAKLLCLDAFASDLFRRGRSRQLVIILDALQRADEELRRWLFRALVKKNLLSDGDGRHRCVFVLSGERLEPMLREQFSDYESHFECISALSSWELADTKRMLEVHKLKGLRPHQIRGLHRYIVTREVSLAGALAIAEIFIAGTAPR